MTTFVLVAGSYHGGWCWSEVAALLRAGGHDVHAPTLTGLGDRAHLHGPQVRLATHVEDLARLVHYEDLHDVVIVAHSYGGVPAGGVVDRMPERFSHAVYFDALIPRDGAATVDLLPAPFGAYFTDRAGADGRIPLAPDSVLRWGLDGHPLLSWVQERLTDQPTATFTDPLPMRAAVEEAGPLPVYVYATVKPTVDLFTGHAEHARTTPGWIYREIDAPHDYMITHPEQTAGLLDSLARERRSG